MPDASTLHRLRSEAELNEEAARYMRVAVDAAHGRGRHDEAAAIEAVAVARENAALRLKLEAASLAASLHLRTDLAEVAQPFAQGVA